MPRADLVLFVTSADRPFTETERAFLERIRDWGKKIVVAINKVDILESEQEVDQVRAFVARPRHPPAWRRAGDLPRQRPPRDEGQAGGAVRVGAAAGSRLWSGTCTRRWTRRAGCA